MIPQSIFNDPVYAFEPYNWLEYFPFANFIVDILKPKILVEPFTQTGNSYFAFCQAAKELNTTIKCYSFGQWSSDKFAAGNCAETFEKASQFNQKHFAHFSKIFQSTAREALSQFEDQSIDLLHIDGHQNYDALKRDFETWKPKLSSASVVLFHNTMIHDKNAGAWKIFEELQSLHPSYQLRYGHGLGAICTGKNANKNFLSFIGEADKNSFYQNLFPTLGSRLLLKQLFNDEKKRSRELEIKAGNLSHENSKLSHTINAINEALDLQKKANEQIEKEKSRLYNQLSELQQEINKQKQLLATSAFQIDQLKDIIAGTEKSISWKLTAPLRYFNKMLSSGFQYSIIISKTIRHFVKSEKTKAKKEIRLLKNALLIKRSGRFDKDYYLRTNPDIGQKKQDCILHFLLHGTFEGRNPSEDFITNIYLENYPDVALSGINPFVHYLKHGIAESRNAKSLIKIPNKNKTAKTKQIIREPLNVIPCSNGVKCLKLYPRHDIFTNHNYSINYGMWDYIDADKAILEESYGLNFDKFDFVFLPMRKRWTEHSELLNLIKAGKAKTVLFDNDSCYYHFSDAFYDGFDFIYYRSKDHAGNLPKNGKYLPWSIDTRRYTPKYGGQGILFSCNTLEYAYPLRHHIKSKIKGLNIRFDKGQQYIVNLQNSAAAIHTDSLIAPVARAKAIEFASCGTQIISNRTEYMNHYFSDDLITYFDSVDQLQSIVDQFQPNIEIQKELRRQTELKHDDRIRAMEIIQDLKQW
jgi:hypothetical protein